MSFFKKATDKLKEVQAEATGKLKQVTQSGSHHQQVTFHSNSNPSASTPPPIPSRPGTGSACNVGRFIVRNPKTGQLEVEGTGEVIRFANLCAPEVSQPLPKKKKKKERYTYHTSLNED